MTNVLNWSERAQQVRFPQELICCFFKFVHDAHEMSHFSTALTEIVEHSFSGKWAELARACGLDASVVSRLAAAKFSPKIELLEKIASKMNRHDRRQILLAAARDSVPQLYQSELFGDEDPASALLRAKLSPDLAAVIRFLESNAMSDAETAAYLRRIGSWVGITTPAKEPVAEIVQFSRVAEDSPAYKVSHSHTVIRRGSVAAGGKSSADVEEEEMPSSKAYPSNHYALRVLGRSMEPKIPDGSLIVVKTMKDQGFPKKGSIVVYNDGYGATLKLFDYAPAEEGDEHARLGKIPVLKSINPDFPDVEPLEGGRIDAVFVEILE